MENDEKNQLMFIQLVSMFQAAALQQMGKLKNPATDKIERDLEQAQLSIDLIDMLRVKTKGNLSGEEDKIVATILQELKLNYVDEMAKGAPAPSAEKAQQ
jgi:Domain of unknown function (DUF1844)